MLRSLPEIFLTPAKVTTDSGYTDGLVGGGGSAILRPYSGAPARGCECLLSRRQLQPNRDFGQEWHRCEKVWFSAADGDIQGIHQALRMDGVARHPARYTTTVASLYCCSKQRATSFCVAGTLVVSVASLVSRQTNGITSTKQQSNQQCLLEDACLICSSCASLGWNALTSFSAFEGPHVKLPR